MVLKIVVGAFVISVLCVCFLIAVIFVFPKSRTKALVAADSEEIAKRLSPAAAAAAAGKLRTIEDSLRLGKPFGTIRLTEDEINSYIRYAMQRDLPPGISNVTVKLNAGRPRGSAEVDFDELKQSLGGLNVPLLGFILSGTHTTAVDGKFSSADGYAQYDTESVSVGSREIPKAAVEMMYGALLKSRFPNFDFNQPFRLPPEVQQLTVESGDVLVKSPDQISAAASQSRPPGGSASGGGLEDKVRDKLKSKGLSLPF